MAVITIDRIINPLVFYSPQVVDFQLVTRLLLPLSRLRIRLVTPLRVRAPLG